MGCIYIVRLRLVQESAVHDVHCLSQTSEKGASYRGTDCMELFARILIGDDPPMLMDIYALEYRRPTYTAVSY